MHHSLGLLNTVSGKIRGPLVHTHHSARWKQIQLPPTFTRFVHCKNSETTNTLRALSVCCIHLKIYKWIYAVSSTYNSRKRNKAHTAQHYIETHISQIIQPASGSLLRCTPLLALWSWPANKDSWAARQEPSYPKSNHFNHTNGWALKRVTDVWCSVYNQALIC
jgi:hypothetical protein